jgi:hypothetical protein
VDKALEQEHDALDDIPTAAGIIVTRRGHRRHREHGQK